jgi:cell division protein FtsQ
VTGAIAAVRLRLAPWGRALTPSPRLRRRAMALAVAALVLTAFYMLWLRDSPLVAVKQVKVTGLTGETGAEARAAIERVAKDSTTLHVDRAAIEKAAESFPVVESVVIAPDFPNSMSIRVIEHRPAALLQLGARKVAVAGDGSVLTGLTPKGSLPTIEIQGGVPTRQLEPGPVLDAARVAGGAPPAITARLEKIERERGRGVVVHVKDGPELVFGDAGRIAAKWAAAVRVLADKDAAGAEYVDVRIPERPAAGGLPVETVAPVAPAGADQPAPAPQDTTPTAPTTPETAAPITPQTPQVPQQAAPAPTQAQPGGTAAPNLQP